MQAELVALPGQLENDLGQLFEVILEFWPIFILNSAPARH
jgi:hypothetical protein